MIFLHFFQFYAGIFLCFVWFRNQTQPPTIGRWTIGTWKVWHLLAVDFACIFVYGLYTTLFKHHLADNMLRYDSVNMPAMMAVSIKQIYGYVCWAALFLTSAFLLLDFPRVRTGLHKLPYWPVYAIQYLTRKR